MKHLNRIGSTARLIMPIAGAAIVACLSSSLVFAADPIIYKSIAEDGSTVFTDTPSGDAQSFEPAELNVTTPPKQTKKSKRTNNAQAEAALKALTVKYVKILSPAKDQTFINPVGAIPVSITTGHDGKLPLGHNAQIILNGKVVGSGSTLNYSFPAPHRGTHTLSTRVYDASGKLRARSKTVSIHIIKSVAGGK